MRVHEFQTALWLPLPPERLFPFFADAANLDAITPPWLHFQILTPPPIVMGEGTLIDYRLRVHGVPLRWRTRINVWQPPRRFVDEQIRGPYRLWVHEHSFEPRDGGTLACDHVRYAVPLDWLLHPLFVRRDIERIFQFRAEALRRRFANPEARS
ncbi:MAG: SRPBCC family protein [Verrucomicrobiae bacterium]|nr:SRPBCC family protein [Verrucomicrobiae bacterium]MDW8309614.1 SRPBCC family protein [Verrucomicrobiales bacterium]